MRIRTIAPLILALAALTLAGCDRERSDWRDAEAADTITAYQNFLLRYPDGTQATEARQRLAALQRAARWAAASEADTVDAYRQFLAEFPEGEEADRARARLEVLEPETEWAAVQDSPSVEALRAFAERYPEHPARAEALERATALEAAAREAEARRLADEQARREEEARARQLAEGTHRVQLAALRTEARARQGADMLGQQLADVLGAHRIEVDESAGFFRLRTTPMPHEEAAALCRRLRSQGQDCMVVSR
jgi:hypothetical protein